MPLKIIPGLEPKHLKKSVYSYIKKDLNLEIQSSHIWIKGDLAREFDARILEIPEHSFIIEVEKIVSLSKGIIFEYSLTRHLYKNFVFEAVFVEI